MASTGKQNGSISGGGEGKGDNDPLPAHVRLTMALNDVALTRESGFFWYMPATSSSSTVDDDGKSSPTLSETIAESPSLLFSPGTWSPAHIRNYSSASRSTRCYGTDFLAFPPGKPGTKLWGIRYVDLESVAAAERVGEWVAQQQQQRIYVFALRSAGMYCISVGELISVAAVGSEKASGASAATAGAVDLSWMCRAPGNIADQARWEALGGFRVADYEALFARIVKYASVSPAFSDAESLLTRIPGVTEMQRLFQNG